MKKAIVHAFILLFSTRSLDAVYRLFIDQADEEIFQEEIADPDDLYAAYQYLVASFKHRKITSVFGRSIVVQHIYLKDEYSL